MDFSNAFMNGRLFLFLYTSKMLIHANLKHLPATRTLNVLSYKRGLEQESWQRSNMLVSSQWFNIQR